jgi:hypothetical protein
MGPTDVKDRTYLKKVFEPNLYGGLSFQVLEILDYVCGLRPTAGVRMDGKSRFAGILDPAFLSRWVLAGDLGPKSFF